MYRAIAEWLLAVSSISMPFKSTVLKRPTLELSCSKLRFCQYVVLSARLTLLRSPSRGICDTNPYEGTPPVPETCIMDIAVTLPSGEKPALQSTAVPFGTPR